jgi:hypothetical protein
VPRGGTLLTQWVIRLIPKHGAMSTAYPSPPSATAGSRQTLNLVALSLAYISSSHLHRSTKLPMVAVARTPKREMPAFLSRPRTRTKTRPRRHRHQRVGRRKPQPCAKRQRIGSRHAQRRSRSLATNRWRSPFSSSLRERSTWARSRTPRRDPKRDRIRVSATAHPAAQRSPRDPVAADCSRHACARGLRAIPPRVLEARRHLP